MITNSKKIFKLLGNISIIAFLSVAYFGFMGTAFADVSVTTTATTSGSYTVPAGVTSLKVDVTAGGGGGGGGAFTYAGGGGGGGGSILGKIISVTPGQVILYTVGTHGNGGGAGSFSQSGGNGTNGGSSSFGTSTVVLGGHGGQGAIVSGNGGFGGLAGGVGGMNGGNGDNFVGQRCCGGKGGDTLAGIGGNGGSGNSESYTLASVGTNGGGGGGASGWKFDSNGFADAGANGGDGIITISYTIDTTAPVITILGSNPLSIVATTTGSYVDAGATAFDNIDGNITSRIASSSNVNISVVGNYSVIYTVSDNAGNSATGTRVVYVLATADTVAPVITILGSNPINVTRGSTYTDAGATALDNVDGVVAVTASGTVNTSATGTYFINYRATDSSGNVGTATRTVNVISVPTDMVSPVIFITGGTPTTVILGSVYTDQGATAFDNIDGTTTVTTIFNNVNTSATGTYSVVYSATDTAGNNATATRTVNIIAAPADRIPPVIFITGGTPTTVLASSTYTDQGATAYDNVDGTTTVATILNNVDTNILGTYSVTYSATDTAGNNSQATRTVNVVVATSTDNIPPVIFITGGTPITILVGTVYVDQGATAFDNVDGTTTATTTSNNVNSNVVGNYHVVYTATDVAGNVATATRDVNVISASADVTPPVITIIGGTPITVLASSTYNDLGATAFDNIDGTTTVTTIFNNVNTSATGTYSVVYSATDTAGNNATATRTVIVIPKDITAPVITLFGSNPMTVVKTLPYVEPGAIAIDNFDGNVPVIITGSVNTSATGTYMVIYTATDSSGNIASTTRTVNVVPDTIPPVITINGSSTLNILINSVYTDLGATAFDNVDGTTTVTATGTVNTTATGTYFIIYSSTDSSGNVATATRRVNVVPADITPPVITILGTNPATVFASSTYTDAGATAFDNVDGTTTVATILNNVNTSATGTYSVVYSATDTAGNNSHATRTVNVILDTIPPVITIIGSNPASLTVGTSYTDAGATAFDNASGTTTVTTILNNVNSNIIGNYQVVYSATDTMGNNSHATRTVNVIASNNNGGGGGGVTIYAGGGTSGVGGYVFPASTATTTFTPTTTPYYFYTTEIPQNNPPAFIERIPSNSELIPSQEPESTSSTTTVENKNNGLVATILEALSNISNVALGIIILILILLLLLAYWLSERIKTRKKVTKIEEIDTNKPNPPIV